MVSIRNIPVLVSVALASVIHSFPIDTVIQWGEDPFITRALGQAEEDMFLHTRPIIISLGDTCQAALNLMYNKLRFMAYPFDWLVTPFEDMYHMIETDFIYCRQREYFGSTDNPLSSMNMYYPNVHAPHAPTATLFDDLNRRIDRFYKAIHHGEQYKKTIFFIVHSLAFTDNSVKETVTKLCNLLIKKFPDLPFVVVAMHHNPHMPGIIKENNHMFCYLEHGGWTQISYHEWSIRLKECGLINPHNNQDGFSEHPFH